MNQYDSVPFKIRRKAIGELLDFASNYFLCQKKGVKKAINLDRKKNKKKHKFAHHILYLYAGMHTYKVDELNDKFYKYFIFAPIKHYQYNTIELRQLRFP